MPSLDEYRNKKNESAFDISNVGQVSDFVPYESESAAGTFIGKQQDKQVAEAAAEAERRAGYTGGLKRWADLQKAEFGTSSTMSKKRSLDSEASRFRRSVREAKRLGISPNNMAAVKMLMDSRPRGIANRDHKMAVTAAQNAAYDREYADIQAGGAVKPEPTYADNEQPNAVETGVGSGALIEPFLGRGNSTSSTVNNLNPTKSDFVDYEEPTKPSSDPDDIKMAYMGDLSDRELQARKDIAGLEARMAARSASTHDVARSGFENISQPMRKSSITAADRFLAEDSRPSMGGFPLPEEPNITPDEMTNERIPSPADRPHLSAKPETRAQALITKSPNPDGRALSFIGKNPKEISNLLQTDIASRLQDGDVELDEVNKDLKGFDEMQDYKKMVKKVLGKAKVLASLNKSPFDR